jgi:hypothetical protein
MFASRFKPLHIAPKETRAQRKTGGVQVLNFLPWTCAINFSITNAKGELRWNTQQTLPVPRGVK